MHSILSNNKLKKNMHSISQPQQVPPQERKGLFGKIHNLWYKGNAPSWEPSNFQPSNEALQNKDTLIREAEQVFYLHDKDKSGYLEKKEFKKAIQALGLEKKQSKMLGRMVNKDASGRIGIDEFVNAFLYVKGGGEILEKPGKKHHLFGIGGHKEETTQEQYQKQQEELQRPYQQ